MKDNIGLTTFFHSILSRTLYNVYSTVFAYLKNSEYIPILDAFFSICPFVTRNVDCFTRFDYSLGRNPYNIYLGLVVG